MIRPAASSFKFKLVALLRACSRSFRRRLRSGASRSVAKQSEVRRVDARLQAGLRAAVAAVRRGSRRATREANALAHDRGLPACPRARRRAALAGAPALRGATSASSAATSGSATACRSRPSGASASSAPDDLLGYVIASVPFDRALLRKVKATIGPRRERTVRRRPGRAARRRRGVDPGTARRPARPPDDRLDSTASECVCSIATRPAAPRPSRRSASSRRRTRSTRRRSGIQQRLLVGSARRAHPDRARRVRRGPLDRADGLAASRTPRTRSRAGSYDERVPGARPRRAREARQRVQPDGRPAAVPARGARVRAPPAARGRLPLRRRARRDARRRPAAARDRRDRGRGDRRDGRDARRRRRRSRRGRRARDRGRSARASRSARVKSTFGTLFLFGRTLRRGVAADGGVARRPVGRSRSTTRSCTGSSSGRRSWTGSPGSRTGARPRTRSRAELSRAARFGGPLSVVIGDLDDFKRGQRRARARRRRHRAP